MQSKSGPAHELDSLAPWGQWSFMCTDKSLWKKSCNKHSGNKASQFFYMLVLALFVNLASQTQPMLARIAFSIKVLCQGLACLYAPVNCSASFHAVWATGCLFRQLFNHPGGCTAFMQFRLFVNHSVSFQAIWQHNYFSTRHRLSYKSRTKIYICCELISNLTSL